MNNLKKYLIGAALSGVLIASWAVASVLPASRTAQAQSLLEKKWETTIVRGGSLPEGLQGVLNLKGEEGWELVDVVQSKEGNYVAFLKRRKQ